MLPQERTFISILTLAEIDQGTEALPEADDRRERYQRFRSHLEAQFSGRILELDNETVRLWGALSGRYRRAFGGKAQVIDAMLAACAQRRRLHLATRNVRDVRQLGGSAFDPWADNPADFPLQM
jgi:predicted nucleic acid-binding protein